MWLARLTPAQLGRLQYGEAFAGLLESFVAAELLRQRTWSAREFSIFHYRNRNKNNEEVDLVLEFNDGSIIGIEVKIIHLVLSQPIQGSHVPAEPSRPSIRGRHSAQYRNQRIPIL